MNFDQKRAVARYIVHRLFLCNYKTKRQQDIISESDNLSDMAVSLIYSIKDGHMVIL